MTGDAPDTEGLPGDLGELDQAELGEALTRRFFRYVAVPSQSDASVQSLPSSPGQRELAELLAGELRALGLQDVHLDEQSILTARRPGDLPGAPGIGFVAHLDTVDVGLSPEIRPQVLTYTGEPVALRRNPDIWFLPQEHPEAAPYTGEEIIFSDGTSVLGADNKAAIAVIMELLARLQRSPFPCGDLYVAFVPDEEIGLRGAKVLDLNRFAPEFAYTIDTEQLGSFVYETFNAAAAEVEIEGVPAHPISAKGVLVNPVLVACDLIARLDRLETPEHTEGREGYFYVTDLQAGAARARLNVNIRDFDRQEFARRKAHVEEIVQETRQQHPGAVITLRLEDVYSNIADALGDDRRAVTLLEAAFAAQGLTPQVVPMRGGTDGSALSVRGLPTPNFFTGAHNFHSRFEFLPLRSLVSSYRVAEDLCRLAGEVARQQAQT
ncbi:peptidase T [Deinococcus piscis]|uniref:Peptidase T n=1 Tax=Deinococcus piscis TaxID=394230 RepID=A0ABQ3K3U5_9DEIO|nr:peptidase T [Deinococcus piscis]GHG02767.1 peptidase T [Deinococcus piscis]